MKPTEVPQGTRSADPNRALGYIVAGVLLYGGLGWLADRWWGTGYLVVVGILLGAGLGLYMVFRTFGYHAEEPHPDTDPDTDPDH